jgi:hypothetical protein
MVLRLARILGPHYEKSNLRTSDWLTLENRHGESMTRKTPTAWRSIARDADKQFGIGIRDVWSFSTGRLGVIWAGGLAPACV